MCGILGFISKKNDFQHVNLKPALSAMGYRGPDSMGIWTSPCQKVNFGHVRLSIVELSELGHQPMLRNGNSITFNGEIYNYVELRDELIKCGVLFKSQSDTEVILQGYNLFGENYFNKLNGAYAFAIYDSINNKVVLCRDRVGEKPLFYSNYDEKFYFSSDLKALLTLSNIPRKLSKNSLFNYFQHGYATGSDEFWINNVFSLEPGTIRTIYLNDNLEQTTTRYWVLPVGKKENTNHNYLYEKLSYLINDAVKLQLRCDVPASILLSGGVDSSMLTAIASTHTRQVKTFTVKFPGYSQFDESESARLIANYFGTEHTEIEGANISPDLFLKIAKSIDTPINDSSLLPTYLVNYEVSKYCRVALGGDGGDELFGGYKHYERMQKLENIKKRYQILFNIMPIKAFRNFLPLNSKYRNWIKSLEYNLNIKVPNIRSFYDENRLSKLLPNIDPDYWDNDKWGINDEQIVRSILKNCSVSDFKHYLRDSILVKSDRCSMLNSIEARAPILDYRIIEFAFNEVPDNFKIRNGMKKFLLKDISKKILPNEFDFQRKLGFNLPLGMMIREGKWKEFFGDILNSKSDIINYYFYTKMFDEHLSGKEHTDRLFGIVLFLIWAKHNKVSL
ncbi:TPA: asparagine synthase (glutamine-hydrolyzing) [Proteus mirabilis]|uniref:asparagine synthase (glutamine-hydrolyzing) n=2 Tax=Proteus mirabilis TaxID=584 RepID=UPI0013DE8E6A|nr:asparagine synthase (glutamine-hydrolyzing) [Proteus mirabilis]EKW7427486.1 asparagine synthase (glutamine-hydrolyzing) [Proteus mirabilis]ELB1231538.1 asparagine synthase (glutamine-hydrolyzing) [Proteus mirabilis]MCL8580736.1 asparagine synthase (glutamine-hydrolyzing) [Proteus mirabilis]MCL8591902.1 asparagine synthase (glutamine-hydrolyzing) [Proteus mirabilis]MCL8605938.1 asparagine synthase (glutamine-hydrolyzing) [Proteus mirabilis]